MYLMYSMYNHYINDYHTKIIISGKGHIQWCSGFTSASALRVTPRAQLPWGARY